jgi:hypothetical protein
MRQVFAPNDTCRFFLEAHKGKAAGDGPPPEFDR